MLDIAGIVWDGADIINVVWYGLEGNYAMTYFTYDCRKRFVKVTETEPV